MNIQIFGLKKCSETRKAQRFFKERRIPFHFIDLSQKEMSKGRIALGGGTRVPLEDLIDTAGKRFVEKGLTHASLNAARIETLLLEDALLIRTPVVRNGKDATVGHCPEVWKTWS